MSKSIQIQVPKRPPTEVERNRFYALVSFSKKPQSDEYEEYAKVNRNGQVKIIIKKNNGKSFKSRTP